MMDNHKVVLWKLINHVLVKRAPLQWFRGLLDHNENTIKSATIMALYLTNNVNKLKKIIILARKRENTCTNYAVKRRSVPIIAVCYNKNKMLIVSERPLLLTHAQKTCICNYWQEKKHVHCLGTCCTLNAALSEIFT